MTLSGLLLGKATVNLFDVTWDEAGDETTVATATPTTATTIPSAAMRFRISFLLLSWASLNCCP